MSERALKRGVILILIATLFLLVYGQEACTMEPAYSLVKVKSVDGEIIQLSNMQKIKLAGIKIPANYKDETEEYINNITKNCKVFVVPIKPDKQHSEMAMEAFLFLWGNKQIDLSKLASIEKRGFGNIKEGIFNVRKGLGVNLNAFLVRRGYCVVDDSVDIPNKNEFLSLQKIARDEGIGFWAKVIRKHE